MTALEPYLSWYVPPSTDAARLSRILFSAREEISMWADVIESRYGPADSERGLVAEIDAYREERGWSPRGFGGEIR